MKAQLAEPKSKDRVGLELLTFSDSIRHGRLIREENPSIVAIDIYVHIQCLSIVTSDVQFDTPVEKSVYANLDAQQQADFAVKLVLVKKEKYAQLSLILTMLRRAPLQDQNMTDLVARRQPT